MIEHFPHVVIGGGISGLGAAHFALRRGVETLVLEQSGRVGGTLHSVHFTACAGFWTEAGGHTCYNSYGNLLSILDDLGLIPLLRPKEKVPFRLWRDGERHSIFSALHPFELVAGLPRLLALVAGGQGAGRVLWRGLGPEELPRPLRPGLSGGGVPAAGRLPRGVALPQEAQAQGPAEELHLAPGARGDRPGHCRPGRTRRCA